MNENNNLKFEIKNKKSNDKRKNHNEEVCQNNLIDKENRNDTNKLNNISNNKTIIKEEKKINLNDNNDKDDRFYLDENIEKKKFKER